MTRSTRFLIAVAVLASACSTGTVPVVTEDTTDATTAVEEVTPDAPEPEISAPEVAPEDVGIEISFDAAGDVALQPECAPGDGCFLDPCVENSACQSGWCVDHMGDAVCSMHCQEECPNGWNCQQVGSGPDVLFICISKVASLCKPCASGADCKGVGGADGVCVDYGDEGSFCGGSCATSDECPWGFSCQDAETVDGIAVKQCLADAGVCPCTSRSVELGLWTPCAAISDVGTCTGKRVCTADGLTSCDASEPTDESCNGFDDDCDGAVDEPTEEGGNLINLCDDGNECTTDICDGEAGCDYAPVEGDECKDGNPCTVADHCVQGICVGSSVDCDDNDPCTDDTCGEAGGCQYAPNAVECDDQDPCTVGDQCKNGECAGFQTACDCQADIDCAALEDGDLCNGTLVCDVSQLPFQCEVDEATVVVCDEPAGVDAPCLEAVCDPLAGSCSLAAAHDQAPCDDGDDCALGDACAGGLCLAGTPVNCNDGNACSADSCSEDDGCVHGPADGPCNDGDVCTLGDKCTNGVCVGGLEALACDDANTCTTDVCDAALGCTYTANGGACDDGNPCTVGDHCEGTACVVESILVCNDDNLCTNDLCDPAQGCLHLLNQAPCNDGNKCTTLDTCNLGECAGSEPLVCSDGNGCTSDSCDPLVGCKFEPTTAACDDGNLCTQDEQCANGTCVASGMLDCDDDNPCTTDGCDPVAGCTHVANAAPCDDGNVCTIGDHCDQGACTGGPSLDCDNGNPCTDDACDPQLGCTHTVNAAACTDDNACTEGDHCAEGECQIAGMLTCDDSKICTNDNCDPDVGCVHSANTQLCDDGDACTTGDQCAGGECGGGPAVVCPDDGNPCTTAGCEPATGCEVEIVPDCCGNGIEEAGEECDDGNQVDGDGCSADCLSGVGCSDQAEFHYEVVAGVWACVNNAIIHTYQENNSMCAGGWTPATYKLVQGLPFPTLQQHQAMGNWHQQVMPNNGGFIRTGQKRRGGCTPEAHGDIYIRTNGGAYNAGAGWHDLYQGGSSCNPGTNSANNMSHALAGVVCVAGQYEAPQP